MRRRWTEQRIIQVACMRLAGWTYAQIGAYFGLSKQAVQQAVQRWARTR